ncbi:sugar ABC transporter permease [Nesterenkonia sp. LB17]|uniref:carbohydrate ABC transporter permease n=1 Tax=unclassified Nesterenkonia TaxID=2629769 RepID=UPI001F4C9570|nr:MULTISPECIES: sugar ABC transporter permease [unclassified Nesterenkonia]MCH8566106.1 sugar ABC transporter permease [Nesterenkonia sp. LB17]MCH8571014.1 sugar ABC transporter permease [Nesterenkonia sp. AY15]
MTAPSRAEAAATGSRSGGPAGRTGTGRRKPRISFRHRASAWDRRYSPYLYISPFFLLFAVVGLFPLIYTIWVAAHDWDLIMGQGEFVGTDNFAHVLGQRAFWISLRNTLSIFILSSAPQVVAAILIAYLLDYNLRARTFWRMGVLVPYVVTPVAVALIFSNLFGDRFGLVNSMLETVGIDAVGWHSGVLPSHLAIATMVNFRWTGYNALIFLAAMQAVPRDLYEAAAIDGAGKVRQFISVTIPNLRPTIIFVIITSTIGGLQIFDEPRMFDQYGRGGADGQWQTMTLYLYELGWTRSDFGLASAVAVLLFLLIVAIGLVNFVITRRISSSEVKR